MVLTLSVIAAWQRLSATTRINVACQRVVAFRALPEAFFFTVRKCHAQMSEFATWLPKSPHAPAALQGICLNSSAFGACYSGISAAGHAPAAVSR